VDLPSQQSNNNDESQPSDDIKQSGETKSKKERMKERKKETSKQTCKQI